MAATQKNQSARKQNPSAMLPESPKVEPLQDAMEYLRCYAREKPEMAALWCFGIGFVLGWKLKPW